MERISAAAFKLQMQREKYDFPELRLQRDVTDWLRLVLPGNALWMPVPNGAYMGPREAAKLIRHGMLRSGAPDLFVYHKSRALGIELKADKGRVSGLQADMHAELARAGVPTFVCRCIDDVRAALVGFGVPLREAAA